MSSCKTEVVWNRTEKVCDYKFLHRKELIVQVIVQTADESPQSDFWEQKFGGTILSHEDTDDVFEDLGVTYIGAPQLGTWIHIPVATEETLKLLKDILLYSFIVVLDEGVAIGMTKDGHRLFDRIVRTNKYGTVASREALHTRVYRSYKSGNVMVIFTHGGWGNFNVYGVVQDVIDMLHPERVLIQQLREKIEALEWQVILLSEAMERGIEALNKSRRISKSGVFAEIRADLQTTLQQAGSKSK